jgi:hypothetical protein
VVRDAQQDMGELVADGIYGPATRTRGKALLGRTFPARPSEPKPAPSPKPKAPKPSPAPAPAPAPAPPLKAEPVVLQEPDRVRLERGASYRATLALSGMQSLATNEQVAEVLQESVGPWRDLRVTGSGAARRATGTYAGSTREVARPNEVTEIVRVAAPKPAPQPSAPQPSAPQPSSSPRPSTPKPSAPKPSPAPSQRAPKAAAQSLYDYVSAAIKAGRGATLGTKSSPNAVVRDAQQDMGELVADGIYGPATRTRGKALLGRTFPARQ